MSAAAAAVEAQVATAGQRPCFFLLHPAHHSPAVSHIANTWELTPWKWKPGGKGGHGFVAIALPLMSHRCPALAWW